MVRFFSPGVKGVLRQCKTKISTRTGFQNVFGERTIITISLAGVILL